MIWYVIVLHFLLGASWTFYLWNESQHAKNYKRLFAKVNSLANALVIVEGYLVKWSNGETWEEACPENKIKIYG